MSPASRAVIGLSIVVLAVACSGPAHSTGSSFAASAGPGCMNHQPHPPSRTDRDASQDVAQQLSVLRYYTEHGQQPFCDHRAASAKDLAWMRLFITRGAQRALVARWLPS